MKAIPCLIVGIVVVSLTVNLLLLFNKEYISRYFLVANLITGVSLVTIVLLSLYSRKKIKDLQSRYIHKIFHKN